MIDDKQSDLVSRLTLCKETPSFRRTTGNILVYRDPEHENESYEYGIILNTPKHWTAWENNRAVAVLSRLEKDAKSVLWQVAKKGFEQYKIGSVTQTPLYSKGRREELREVLRYAKSQHTVF